MALKQLPWGEHFVQMHGHYLMLNKSANGTPLQLALTHLALLIDDSMELKLNHIVKTE